MESSPNGIWGNATPGQITRTVASFIAVTLTAVCPWIEPSYAQTEDPVVATVGSSEIRESDLAIAAEYDPYNPARRGRNYRWLAKILVATNSDRGKALEKTLPVQQRFGILGCMALAEHIRAQLKASVTDAAMHELYGSYVEHLRDEAKRWNKGIPNPPPFEPPSFEESRYTLQQKIVDTAWKNFISPLRELYKLQVPEPSSAPSLPDPIVARIADASIHESDLAIYFELLKEKAPFEASPEKRRAMFTSDLADCAVIYADEIGRTMAFSSQFQRRVAIRQGAFILNKIVDEQASASITPDMLHAYHLKYWGGERQEVRARQILVSSEEEANSIVVELNKGADFAELAEKHSKDAKTADQGGILGGYLTKEEIQQRLADLIFSLPVGEISKPFKSPDGWYIFRVDDKRTRSDTKFDNMQQQLRSGVMEEMHEVASKRLGDSIKIEYLIAPPTDSWSNQMPDD